MDLASRRRTSSSYRARVLGSGLPNASYSTRSRVSSCFVPLTGSQRTSRPEQARTSSVIDHGGNTSSIGQSAEYDVEQVIAAIDLKEAGTLGVFQTKPTILLTSTRVDHFNHDGQSPEGENGARPYLPYQLEHFKFLVPHNRLVGTDQLDAENLDFTLEEGRHLQMASFFDLENEVTLGCAGAILTYLQRRRSSDMVAGDTDSGLYQVASFEMSTLDGTMLTHVWQSSNPNHPSMVNQGPGKRSSSQKEGFSVCGLFQRFACIPQGKQRLRQILLQPSVQLDIIHKRHAFISVYLHADNYNLMNKMVKGLKHIKNLRLVLIKLQKGISTGSKKVAGFKATVWATLLAFVDGIDVYDSLKETSSGYELALYSPASNRLNIPLLLVLMMLQALRAFEAAQLFIIDLIHSKRNVAVVKSGVDRDLDRMQDTYDGLNSLLKQVAIEIVTTIPASFEIDVNAAYDGADEGWELIFITENRAYFKDFRMREMDEELGDIYGLICEKEIEIVYDLAQRVLQYEKVLAEASDVCGEIDSLLAMTQAVTCYNLVRPKMSENNIIKIKGGRHLLQELNVSSYVPNDSFLVGGRLEAKTRDHSQHAPEALRIGSNQSMLLLTGPNYLGKSVYMKQVALIVYLTQTGSFIPAESAETGVVDKIIVKSNSQDSVSQPRTLTCLQIQNTFMNDLQQLSFDLKHLTGRSLLLSDESGKGTSENGMWSLTKCLLAQELNEFLRMSPRLQLGHMEVQFCEEYQEADEQITYLYNFRLGHSTKSFGTVCAALNGISQAIVDRANELVTLSARGENLIAACAVLSADEVKALQDAV
ncbi:muts domain V-domain-containing protein [Aspergillus recurvatus]